MTLAMANIYGHRLLNKYSVMSDILDIGVVEAFHYFRYIGYSENWIKIGTDIGTERVNAIQL